MHNDTIITSQSQTTLERREKKKLNCNLLDKRLKFNCNNLVTSKRNLISQNAIRYNLIEVSSIITLRPQRNNQIYSRFTPTYLQIFLFSICQPKKKKKKERDLIIAAIHWDPDREREESVYEQPYRASERWNRRRVPSQTRHVSNRPISEHRERIARSLNQKRKEDQKQDEEEEKDGFF